MKRPAILFSVPVVLIIGLMSRTGHAAVTVPTNFTNQVVISGINEPLPMAFLPDGRLLFGEQRTGRVRLVVNDQIATTDPILTLPEHNGSSGERGLQGIAVDPAWPSKPYLYFFHNRYPDKLRLVRYTASGDLSNPSGQNLSLSAPMLLIDDIPDAQSNHNGGTIRFAPDGDLYVSIGEDNDACAAQDSTSLKGELLRLRVSGLPASGTVTRAMITPSNPALSTTDANAKLVFAYGFRNPWRFHIDSQTGKIYLADVGLSTYEEVNEVTAGQNCGWPYREGYVTRNFGWCNEPGGTGSGQYDMPIESTDHADAGTAATLTAGVYRQKSGGSANWPSSYVGDLFYADYQGGYVRRLHYSAGNWAPAAAVPGQPTTSNWAAGMTFPVDFAIGPDGSLWWISVFNSERTANSGSINRIRYTGGSVGVGDEIAAGPQTLRGDPNPFANQIDLSFTSSRAAQTELVVYDVRGRHVRNLFKGDAPAGETRVKWTGIDDRGSRMPPGIYFVRLDQAGRQESYRVLHVR